MLVTNKDSVNVDSNFSMATPLPKKKLEVVGCQFSYGQYCFLKFRGVVNEMWPGWRIVSYFGGDVLTGDSLQLLI